MILVFEVSGYNQIIFLCVILVFKINGNSQILSLCMALVFEENGYYQILSLFVWYCVWDEWVQLDSIPVYDTGVWDKWEQSDSIPVYDTGVWDEWVVKLKMLCVKLIAAGQRSRIHTLCLLHISWFPGLILEIYLTYMSISMIQHAERFQRSKQEVNGHIHMSFRHRTLWFFNILKSPSSPIIIETRSDRRDFLAIKVKSEIFTEKERPNCCEQFQKIWRDYLYK